MCSVNAQTTDVVAKQFIQDTENGSQINKKITFFKQYNLARKNKTSDQQAEEFVAIYRDLEKLNLDAAMSFGLGMSYTDLEVQQIILKTMTKEERIVLKSGMNKVMADYKSGKLKKKTSSNLTEKPIKDNWSIYKFTNAHWRGRVPKNTKVLLGSRHTKMPRVRVNYKTMPQLTVIVDYIKATHQETGNIFCVVKTYIDDAKPTKSMQISGDNYLYGIAAAVHSLYPSNAFTKAVTNSNIVYEINANIKNNIDGMGSKIVMEDDSGNSIVTNLFHHYGSNELLIHFIKFNKKISNRGDISDQEWEFLETYEWSETK